MQQLESREEPMDMSGTPSSTRQSSIPCSDAHTSSDQNSESSDDECELVPSITSNIPRYRNSITLIGLDSLFSGSNDNLTDTVDGALAKHHTIKTLEYLKTETSQVLEDVKSSAAMHQLVKHQSCLVNGQQARLDWFSGKGFYAPVDARLFGLNSTIQGREEWTLAPTKQYRYDRQMWLEGFDTRIFAKTFRLIGTSDKALLFPYKLSATVETWHEYGQRANIYYRKRAAFQPIIEMITALSADNGLADDTLVDAAEECFPAGIPNARAYTLTKHKSPWRQYLEEVIEAAEAEATTPFKDSEHASMGLFLQDVILANTMEAMCRSKSHYYGTRVYRTSAATQVDNAIETFRTLNLNGDNIITISGRQEETGALISLINLWQDTRESNDGNGNENGESGRNPEDERSTKEASKDLLAELEAEELSAAAKLLKRSTKKKSKKQRARVQRMASEKTAQLLVTEVSSLSEDEKRIPTSHIEQFSHMEANHGIADNHRPADSMRPRTYSGLQSQGSAHSRSLTAPVQGNDEGLSKVVASRPVSLLHKASNSRLKEMTNVATQLTPPNPQSASNKTSNNYTIDHDDNAYQKTPDHSSVVDFPYLAQTSSIYQIGQAGTNSTELRLSSRSLVCVDHDLALSGSVGNTDHGNEELARIQPEVVRIESTCLKSNSREGCQCVDDGTKQLPFLQMMYDELAGLPVAPKASLYSCNVLDSIDGQQNKSMIVTRLASDQEHLSRCDDKFINNISLTLPSLERSSRRRSKSTTATSEIGESSEIVSAVPKMRSQSHCQTRATRLHQEDALPDMGNHRLHQICPTGTKLPNFHAKSNPLTSEEGSYPYEPHNTKFRLLKAAIPASNLSIARCYTTSQFADIRPSPVSLTVLASGQNSFICTYCQIIFTPSLLEPLFLCPGCGPSTYEPQYCSVECLLTDAYRHAARCACYPGYCRLFPASLPSPYCVYEENALMNENQESGSPELFRQRMFSMFCRYGTFPRLSKAWSSRHFLYPYQRDLMEPDYKKLTGIYHVFTPRDWVRETHPNANTDVLFTVCFENRDPFNRILSRTLNALFVHSEQSQLHRPISQFAFRAIRHVLHTPEIYNRFGPTIESIEFIQEAFCHQFFLEFGFDQYMDTFHMMHFDLERETLLVMPYLNHVESVFSVLRLWDKA